MGERHCLRVLVAGIKWPPETFLYRLVRGLAEAGVEVTVGCAAKPDCRGVKWLRMPSWNVPIPLRLAKLVAAASRAFLVSRRDIGLLGSLMNQEGSFSDRLRRWYALLPFTGRRWDVIYFPWIATAAYLLPVTRLGMPVVVSCRGRQINIAPHNPQRLELRNSLPEVFNRASAVHCVSEAIKQEAEKYGLDPKKAWVIRPAVDPEVFRPAESLGDRDGLVNIATTGSLIWRKGHEYALQAVRRVLDYGYQVRFHVVGDGPEKQRVVYTIQDLGLEGVVVLHGRCGEEQVVRLLQQSDVFLLPSLSEGISNAVLEAMACGLPVVTTECGGMREVVTDGVEGFVVPVRDPEAMAGALIRLIESPDLRCKMGRAGRERVIREFTLSQQVQKWLELLEAVACSWYSGERAQ